MARGLCWDSIDFLSEDGRQILVGLNDAGRDLGHKAMVQATMIYDEDADEPKGLVWDVYSVNEADPVDIRDGKFHSDGATPEEAMKLAEEWTLAH